MIWEWAERIAIMLAVASLAWRSVRLFREDDLRGAFELLAVAAVFVLMLAAGPIGSVFAIPIIACALVAATPAKLLVKIFPRLLPENDDEPKQIGTRPDD